MRWGWGVSGIREFWVFGSDVVSWVGYSFCLGCVRLFVWRCRAGVVVRFGRFRGGYRMVVCRVRTGGRVGAPRLVVLCVVVLF